MANKPECWVVHFSGRVQGVGFRFTTTQVARKFAVTGTVENLPDGRVKLIAEGEAGELQAFLAAVEKQMGSCIHDRQLHATAAQGDFSDFRTVG